MAVINGELSGFELKSDSDTLKRLPYQAEIYGKVFDRMTLVVGRKHYADAIERIPDWWSCIVAEMREGKVLLTSKKRGRKNPRLDPFVVAQLLWKDEAIEALAKHNLAEGWRTRRADEISNRLVSELPLKVLTAHVREALKIRPKLGQLGSC